jgi:hypothetical protein
LWGLNLFPLKLPQPPTTGRGKSATYE